MKETLRETEEKLTRLRHLMETRGLSAVLLKKTSSLAWITGGARTWVNTASSEGPVMALVTPHTHLLITNNIEAPRLKKEENLAAAGWSLESTPWHRSPRTLADVLRDYGVAPDLRKEPSLGCDTVVNIPDLPATDLGGSISRLRARLLPAEQDRAKSLGADCAAAMMETCLSLEPGQSEEEIAALLWQKTQRRGIQAVVSLVAVDERIEQYRHPLPTEKILQRHAMVVLCGRRQGLVVSLTRVVHFGPPPEDIRHRQNAVALVDQAMIAASRPGITTGEIFRIARDSYGRAGFPQAWVDHHQGGVAGYEPREYLALPDGSDQLSPGHICAWNPSLPGAKSEDTLLVGETEPAILTKIPGWPLLEQRQLPYEESAPPGVIPRPDILIR
ncbi:antitoxin VapB [Alkalispirochaeta americana]|uniref:Antitoxin VapB n=1 Tax=Alkalispirochaeta americana TaxID=159291 RepID=A0A1N6VF53_9SPIO|nr:M24 family metallopeptidase [Alkalispirochaeta americana]SIQ76464.1 antitoxin VapB [Alkalispirochaeta americana]